MSIKKEGGKALYHYLEKSVVLSANGRNNAGMWNLVLRGRVDLATLATLKGSMLTILFEFTEYRGAPKVTRDRLLAYASAIYGEIGFPVIPVLVITKDSINVDSAYVLISRSFYPGIQLKKAVNRLIRTIFGSEEFNAPSKELCAFCDPSLRRLCPYYS